MTGVIQVKTTFMLIFLGVVMSAAPPSFGEQSANSNLTQCRDLAAAGNYVGPDEVLVDGKVCKASPAPEKASNHEKIDAAVSSPRSQSPVPSPSDSPAAPKPGPAAQSAPVDLGVPAYVKCGADQKNADVMNWDRSYAETVVAKPKCGDEVRVVGSLNGYDRVRTSDGSEGYMHPGDLSDKPVPIRTAAPIAAPVSSSEMAAVQDAQTVISFAIAEDGGRVHPGTPGWVRNWVRKNARKYPGVEFGGTPTKEARNYVIVFSSSANALSGFDPVVRTDTSTSTTPVSGSGTVTDNYGSTWNYTYDGEVTTTTTTTTQEDVPYTIETNTLYATAYDAQGTMVSQHWHVYSTKQGGDGANSLGYNLGNALFAINARGRLLKAVVKDVVRNNR